MTSRRPLAEPRPPPRSTSTASHPLWTSGIRWTELARRCVPPCPTELPPVPPPYRLTQTLSPQPPVAHALRAMPDVCSPTLEQPDEPAPQELEHAVAMPLPGNEVHHSIQAPLPPMLLIEARWPGPNPFASATPRPRLGHASATPVHAPTCGPPRNPPHAPRRSAAAGGSILVRCVAARVAVHAQGRRHGRRSRAGAREGA